MSIRILIMAVALSAVAFWSAEADDVPKVKSEPKGAKDSAAAKKALKQYHTSAVKVFIDTPGFGHERMRPLFRIVEDIHVNWTSQDVDDDKSAVTVPDLAKAHRDRITGFKRDPWMNLKLPGDRVSSVTPGGVKQSWKLHRIDLVALVDHDEPIVYITPRLPNQYRSAKEALYHANREPLDANKKQADAKSHREPNFLELAALDRFRDGEEVVVRTKGDVLQMVGALRATKQCLECHKTAKEGDLFGAFSYTLKKTPN